MLREEGNAFIVFVRPREYTQSILVRNAECKHNRVYKKTPQGAFNVDISVPLNSCHGNMFLPGWMGFQFLLFL